MHEFCVEFPLISCLILRVMCYYRIVGRIFFVFGIYFEVYFMMYQQLGLINCTLKLIFALNLSLN